MNIDEFLDQRMNYPQLRNLVKWFFTNTLNEYLDQNAHQILKSIKQDNPPKEFREFLIEYEKAHKNRPEVVGALNAA